MKIACPQCKRVIPDAPEDFPPRPFCSARCKLSDLHGWLTEAYRIPGPLESSDSMDGEGQEH